MFLQINNAIKCFGTVQALNGFNLELRQGEWLGLLGPNGAGKTTLIRAICGRVKLDQGTISLIKTDGVKTTSVAEIQQNIGIVPQDIALYPLLTAEENLNLFAKLNGVSGRQLRHQIEWALEWTGLQEHRKELIKQFSGGMKRRLNIACGIMQTPKIVLLDEPTIGVDPQSRERIWNMLTELKHQGVSLLLTTHQLDEAQRVCERIVIMDNGHKVAEGNIKALLQRIEQHRRLLKLTMPFPGQAILEGLNLTQTSEMTFERQIGDITHELHLILKVLAEANIHVEELFLETPNLQSVFLSLTGHELRE